MESLDDTIRVAIGVVASFRGLTLPPLERHHTLTYDLGLRSLDLAQLVATLEMMLGADPFARLVPITAVRTVGDLFDAYALALRSPAGPTAAIDTGRAAARRQARETAPRARVQGMR
jgi:hypothetical protein